MPRKMERRNTNFAEEPPSDQYYYSNSLNYLEGSKNESEDKENCSGYDSQMPHAEPIAVTKAKDTIRIE